MAAVYRGAPAILKAGARDAAAIILDLLLPPSCALCGISGELLCETCAARMRESKEAALDWPRAWFRCEFCERCRRCDHCARCELWREARPITPEHVRECTICRLPCRRCDADLERENEEQTVCPECRARRTAACGPQYFPPQIPLLRSAFRYGGAVQQLILALKYEGLRTLAAALVEAAPATRLPNPSRSDVIVPIPMKARDARRRGGNHAGALAAALGARIGVPAEGKLLRRSKKRTVRQASISASGRDAAARWDVVERRWENVYGAFEAPADIDGARVLLVDDVATTTATLQSAAMELRAAGAASVEAWALARRESARAKAIDGGIWDDFL